MTVCKKAGLLDIRQLKAFVAKLPRGHPLRELLLLERDWLTASEFLAKAETWMTLVKVT
jgi:hypothetical protein